MKKNLVRLWAALAVLMTVFPALLDASVEKSEDGTYTISGTWTFWPEKGILAPSGKGNDFGEFQTILFKISGNESFNLKEYKKTFAVFKIKGRESQGEGTKVLIAEEILEVLEGGIPDAKE